MPTLDSLLDEVYGPEQKAAPAPAPKAELAPAGAPSDNSLGSLFSNYVGGPIQDYLVNAIQSASGPGMVRDVSQFLTKAAVPDTLTEAAVTGATLLAPQAKAAEFFGTQARNAPKLLPAVKRMLYPI